MSKILAKSDLALWEEIMPDEFSNMFPRSFIQLSRAWYAEANTRPPLVDDITIHVDDMGWFKIEWVVVTGEVGCRLQVWHDAWKALDKCQDLIWWLGAMDKEGKNPSPSEVVHALVEMGFIDRTPEKGPYDDGE